MVNITPAHTPAPEEVVKKFAAEREAVRRRHGVQPVSAEQEGEAVKRANGGIYGFTYAPQSLDCGLFAKHTYLSFEMHRLGDLSVRLIAAVTLETRKKVETAQEPVEIEFFPEPYAAAHEFLVLPYAALRHVKAPVRDEGNKIKATYQTA